MSKLDIAPYVRLFEGAPTDEFVAKRQTAIKEVAGKFVKPSTIARLLSVADGVVQACKDGDKLPSGLADEVATSISKVSQSFVAEGRDIELSTCAILAVITAIHSGSKSGTLTNVDYLAAGVWSGVSWQQTSKNENFEKLRKFLLDVSRDHVLKAAAIGRIRSQPAKAVDLATDSANLVPVIGNLRSTINTLIANAAVDREEIDLLWWSIAGWSDTLGAKYVDLKSTTAAIALGLDAAKRLRRMPLELHKALVLRRVPEGDAVSFSRLEEYLGEDRTKLRANFEGNTLISENANVFPLLNILVSGSSHNVDTDTISLSNLASRALLEAVTLDVIDRRDV